MSRPKKNSNLDRPRTEREPRIALPSCISFGCETGTGGRGEGGKSMFFSTPNARELWGKAGSNGK